MLIVLTYSDIIIMKFIYRRENMNKKKLLLTTMLSASCFFSLFACGSKTKTKDNKTTNKVTTKTNQTTDKKENVKYIERLSANKKCGILCMEIRNIYNDYVKQQLGYISLVEINDDLSPIAIMPIIDKKEFKSVIIQKVNIHDRSLISKKYDLIENKNIIIPRTNYDINVGEEMDNPLYLKLVDNKLVIHNGSDSISVGVDGSWASNCITDSNEGLYTYGYRGKYEGEKYALYVEDRKFTFDLNPVYFSVEQSEWSTYQNKYISTQKISGRLFEDEINVELESSPYMYDNNNDDIYKELPFVRKGVLKAKIDKNYNVTSSTYESLDTKTENINIA